MDRIKTKITKKTIALLVVLLVAVGSIGATYAFYSSKTEVKSNVFTIGSIETHINEDFPKQEVKPDSNGYAEFTKAVSVENTGKSDCLVRVRVTISPGKQSNQISLMKDETKLLFSNGSKVGDWIYKDDGYFYYTKVLSSGATTSTLFNKVKVSNANSIEDFDIAVYQEAVQAVVHNADGTKLTFDEDKLDTMYAIWNAYE